MPEDLAVENFDLTVALVSVRCNLDVSDAEHGDKLSDQVSCVDGSVVGVDLLAYGELAEDAEEVVGGVGRALGFMWVAHDFPGCGVNDDMDVLVVVIVGWERAEPV